MSPISDKALRFAIIGAGSNVFRMHEPAFQIDTVELVAFCDISTEPAKQRAEKWGVLFYTDYQEMLNKLQPDVAVIMTPHSNHAEIAINAMRAGSHILIEKPIALHINEADEILAVAQECERLVAVNFQHRYRAEVEAAYSLIHNGKMGEIQRVELVEPCLRTAAYYRAASWRGTWLGEGGGVLMNQAPHGLDLLCYLIGMPQRVFAWTRKIQHSIETEDTVLGMLEWSNNVLGTIFFSTAESGSQRIEIIGTKGKLQLSMGSLSFHCYETDLKEYIVDCPNPFELLNMSNVPIMLGSSNGKHIDVYHNICNSILYGNHLRVSGIQARMSLELANAINYASQYNCVVNLPLNGEKYLALLKRLMNKSNC